MQVEKFDPGGLCFPAGLYRDHCLGLPGAIRWRRVQIIELKSGPAWNRCLLFFWQQKISMIKYFFIRSGFRNFETTLAIKKLFTLTIQIRQSQNWLCLCFRIIKRSSQSRSNKVGCLHITLQQFLRCKYMDHPPTHRFIKLLLTIWDIRSTWVASFSESDFAAIVLPPATRKIFIKFQPNRSYLQFWSKLRPYCCLRHKTAIG